MKHYVITPAGAIFNYRTGKIAEAAAAELQGFVCTTDGTPPKDDLTKVPTNVLVIVHNIIRPEKPVKKFESREIAEKRLQGVLEVLAKPGETPASLVGSADATEVGGDDMAAKAAKKAARAAKPKGEAGAGRPSKYAGMVIKKVEKENPRKKGTSGYKSWELLRSGMTYEAYIAAGGVRRDMEWDLDRGWVKLEKA